MRVVLNGGNGHTRRNAAHDGDDGTARDAIGCGWALRLYPTEKPWGPNFLRSGLNFAWGSRDDARYNIRLAYQMTQLNRSGGELLLTGQLGADKLLGINWYQPLEAGQPWFAETSGLLSGQTVD